MCAYHIEEGTGDIVIDGFENGIASSPHKGIGNIQAGNINTETGEVMVSYKRVLQSQSGTAVANHTINALDGSHLDAGSFPLQNGSWINISASSISGVSTGNYYIQNSNSFTATGQTGATTFQISSYYNSSVLSGFGSSGTATYTLIREMGKPIAQATEPYKGSNDSVQYRYYILDNAGLVWVYDTARVDAGGTGKIHWFLPDYSISYFGSATAPTGMAVLNGWLHVLAGNTIWCKPTAILGDSTANSTNYVTFASGVMLSRPTSTNPHFAFTGHQGKMYYTDGNFLGSVFPNSSLLTGSANIQSYATYTASSTTGTIGTLIGGSLPTLGGSSSTRIPAVFFVPPGGTKPAAITVGTIYYIAYSLGANTFEVFAAASGGSALDIASGVVGTQYFNTYYPISSGGTATITFSPERLNLPFFEVCQSIAELGSNLIIGCRGNTAYPWNQVDTLPGDLISLPEANVAFMLTVNNMVYMFVGSKGNIYITSGSSATLALSVPDYCSGLIEPYFTWGGASYLRGRVYFSILDQTSAHTGQCGGVWSFVPTQNYYQEQGIALRMENQNSYATYNGYATVIVANMDQAGTGPQYWAGWQSTVTSPTYGIDGSSAYVETACTIDTDIIPTGTAIDKKTFSQIEYKLSANMVAGETVQLYYRNNLGSAFVSCGTVKRDSTTSLSGYFDVNFQKTQWLQIQAALNPTGTIGTGSSFIRLAQIRVR